MSFSVSAFGQESENRRSHVSQDERVDQLLRSHRQNNQRAGVSGFRVQIYTDSGNRSKLRTDRVKAEFDARFPRVRSYITYDEPYYRLRVGDFRTRLDAQRFLNEISSIYPAAHIVPDRIQFPRLEGENPLLD
ncbi:MAG: SPOR domain-containing protein [Bacteroidales bacterium]